MKIALIQMKTTADKALNLSHARELVLSAKDKGADLAILPEMFICPYENPAFPVYAEKEGGESFVYLSNLAKEAGLMLLAGSVPEEDAGRIYNTAYVFGKDGSLLAKHRKVHLFDIDVPGGQRFFESDTLSPGDTATVFDTPFGKAGLCICYDMRFPEMFKKFREKGVKLILIPAAFNMTTGPLHWELLLRSRAMDCQSYVCAVSPARDLSASYHAWGHSMAVDPWGKVLAEAAEGEEMLLVELEAEAVRSVRQAIPVLQQAKEVK